MEAIVITLPKDLIRAIVKGQKKYEMRKSVPLRLDMFNNVVLVIEKGTTNIVAAFSISSVIKSNSPHWLYYMYGKKLGVSKKFIEQYTENCKEVYLWKIENVKLFKNPIPRSRFGIKTNPQNYSYVTINQKDHGTN